MRAMGWTVTLVRENRDKETGRADENGEKWHGNVLMKLAPVKTKRNSPRCPCTAG